MPRATHFLALVNLAWFNVIVHVAALAWAGFGMRPGSPLAPLTERMAYLAGSPWAWTLNWAIWIGCAIGLIAYLAVLAHRLESDTSLVRLGLTLAVVGAAFDLLCNSIFLVILPMLAAQPASVALFLLVERATGIGSLVVANGFYSIAMLLFTLALVGRPGVGRWTTALGLAVAGSGLILAAAGYTGHPWHAAAATLPTIGLFCVWVVQVAYVLCRSNRPASSSSSP